MNLKNSCSNGFDENPFHYKFTFLICLKIKCGKFG